MSRSHRPLGTAAAWAMAGAVAAGGVAWLLRQALAAGGRNGRAARANGALQANALKALALKEAGSPGPDYPSSRTAGQGMRPIPNRDAVPSGALDQEGHRPVLERSRKVR
jgi:hypothetical protein